MNKITKTNKVRSKIRPDLYSFSIGTRYKTLKITPFQLGFRSFCPELRKRKLEISVNYMNAKYWHLFEVSVVMKNLP